MTEVDKHTTRGWTSTDQSGLPGHCYMAQVFGSDGNALAFVEPTNPSTLASERARLIAAAPVMLDALQSLPDPQAFDGWEAWGQAMIVWKRSHLIPAIAKATGVS